MGVSCSCDWDGGGICCIGTLPEMTCRTPRKCYACNKQINSGDIMYRQNLYDYDDYKFVAPLFFCEECGDMMLNLEALGYCYNLAEPIRSQWIEYLRENDPSNPAIRGETQ